MKRQKALLEVTIPVEIAGQSCTVTCDVIEGALLLLLGKKSMNRAGFVIDMKSDRLIAFGQSIALETSTSGHYSLPITKNISKVVSSFISDNDKLHETDILKLHKQFGHCTTAALTKLLKEAGQVVDIRDIETVVSACNICKRTAKKPLKPVVALAQSTKFNECIAMDLHQIEPGLYYRHMICLFAKYSVVVIIRSKEATVFAASFLRYWVSVFGPPENAIFSDNGGEVSNDIIRSFCEKFNLSVKTTAAYPPFSNGVCEWHNSTLTHIFNKVRLEYPNLDLDTCLAYCCYAKNSLYSNVGFTPFQIVMGKSAAIPTIIDNKPPALEGTCMSEIVADHISLLHRTRVEYLKTESCGY